MMAVALCLSAAVSSAQASTYTGVIVDVRAAPSPQTQNNIRVSIQIAGSGPTSCPYPGWYSFDLPTGPTESLWSAILLSAISDGGSVTIAGNETCDVYGMEEVGYIDALPLSP